MNQNRKKTAAILMAASLSVAGNLSVYAETAAIADVEISTNASGTVSGTQDSVLTGTIKVTQISVKVPTAAAFEINPNKKVTSPAVDRITAQSTDYTITNTSQVPIDVSITGVATTASGGFTDDAGQLTGVGNDKKVMFAIRKEGETAPTSEAGDKAKWFTDNISQSAPYQVCATPADNTIAAGKDLKMHLYGATVQGWENGNSFTVTPTFTIAVK